MLSVTSLPRMNKWYMHRVLTSVMSDATWWSKGHNFINTMPTGILLTVVERGGNDNSLQHSSASPLFLGLQNKTFCSRPEQPCHTGWDSLIAPPCFLQQGSHAEGIHSFASANGPTLYLHQHKYPAAGVTAKSDLSKDISSKCKPGDEYSCGMGVGNCTAVTAGYAHLPLVAPLGDQTGPFFYPFCPLFHLHIACASKANNQAAFHCHGWKTMPSTAASQPEFMATNTGNTVHAHARRQYSPTEGFSCHK